jgi:hypothetical protein
MDRKAHWEDVSGKKKSNEVSWYQTEPQLSLQIIDEVTGGQKASIIDVGGGAARLADRLLDGPSTGVTVLDLSGAALRETGVRGPPLPSRDPVAPHGEIEGHRLDQSDLGATELFAGGVPPISGAITGLPHIPASGPTREARSAGPSRANTE